MVCWINKYKIILFLGLIFAVTSCNEVNTSNITNEIDDSIDLDNDGFIYNNLSYKFIDTDSNKLILEKYYGNEKELKIESKINFNNREYTVCSIGDFAFLRNESLENVIIDEGIEYIGLGAFSFTNIKTINLPKSLKMIYTSAFASSKLESILIKYDYSYADGVFSCCENLKCVTFEEGVTQTPAFEMCKNIEKISLASTINDLTSYKFKDCTNIKEIVLNNNQNYYIKGNSLYSIDNKLIIQLKTDDVQS